MRLYIDMDGVLCDIEAAHAWARTHHPRVASPQSIPGLFRNMAPVEGAIEAVTTLRGLADVWILSDSSVRNPNCYSEKRIWVEQALDYGTAKKLILATDKSLLKGEFLVDANLSGKSQDRFEGEIIHFGSSQFPCWSAVVGYLRPRLQIR